jgi:protein TonB
MKLYYSQTNGLILYSKVNKAYELRKSNNKTTVRALIFGAIVFAIAVSMPLILGLLPFFRW